MKRKSTELGDAGIDLERRRDSSDNATTAASVFAQGWAVAPRSGSQSRVAASSSSVENRLPPASMELVLATDAGDGDTNMNDTGAEEEEEEDDGGNDHVGDVTLRQWLRPGRTVDRVACLHIFKQVLEFVELAQKQGVILRTIRPSCFMISPLHRITFIESASSSDRSSEHSTGRAADFPEQDMGMEAQRNVDAAATTAQPDDQWTSSFDPSEPSSHEIDENFPLRQVLAKEQTWYTSPEELAGGASSFASDVYSLGVLFFELFCVFSSNMEWSRAMSDLRHRILPPRLLSESPKEAALCLWLLHPEPQSRPKAREIFQCELFSEAGEALAEREAAVDIEEKEADSALLLEFLLRVQQEKEEAAQKLCRDVQGLSTDIDEVEKRRGVLKHKGLMVSHAERDRMWSLGGPRDESFGSSSRHRLDLSLRMEPTRVGGDEAGPSEGNDIVSPVAESRRHSEVLSRSARLMRNFSQLEQAYFSMRWKVDPPGVDMDVDGPSSGGKQIVEASPVAGSANDRLGGFFDSLCKYARYSRFEVKATLRHGDLLNTANMVCSLSFDRDEEFFATAGVCKKIKVFECDTVLNEHVDIHYPVVEMASRSKLSNICWNSYIKSHLASSDYDGVIQLWDASTSQTLVEYKEHEKRAWSVDFSHADPTKLASGSDDGTVKLWSINQEASTGTIKTKANVCCVQFPSDSAHLLTFGSADYKIYCYDLRNTKGPLCILSSHNKAVSYVRFVDSSTIVSASTDNTLKLWDLSKVMRNGNSSNACGLTYTGHTNEKNFVGLSVSDGYIACGSETNAVFCYHKSLPMPLATHKFGSSDPVSGQENEDDGGQFVSSVCWRGKSQTLLAANSMGNIKVLELV
ncbi:protein SPA1-RELATED 4 [Selaginella moellendorffii]|uniref:protein SPA1-RELATED 4 n=1 Tax=Selaginella moellendorffii TaxID=88036 RepID=UPI000D1CBAE0|nr:protein SPA1-RELATED 4 [Selaginella moellendorffii]|eukprot:XP_024545319.1 protein SPA1-RELATED 4 [Selaginella moellendorffii]